MIRKWIGPVLAAVALMLVVGSVALAADEPSSPPNSPGQCVNFVDADGDGVCDNAQAAPRDGTGSRNGAGRRQAGMGQGANGQGANGQAGSGQGGNGDYVDADGDGVCDNHGQNVPPRDGTGRQNGRGQRDGRGGRP